MQALPSLVFAFLALAAAVGLIALSVSGWAQVYLALPQTFANWRRLCSARPREARVVWASQLGYHALVEHVPGWFLLPEGPISARAARVHVAPDAIARLDYVDAWRGTRFLDSSAFCLARPTAAAMDVARVQFIYRSRRVHFMHRPLDEKLSLKSKGGVPINYHLAGHVRTRLGLTDEKKLEALFAASATLINDLHESIKGLLREEFIKRTYDACFRDVPQIINWLNASWHDAACFETFREYIDFELTALVIIPRREAEVALTEKHVTGMASLDDDIETINKEIENDIAGWKYRWSDQRTSLGNALKQLDRSIDTSIQASAGGLRDNLQKMGEERYVVESVHTIFMTGREQLRQGSEAMSAAVDDLGEFLRDLDAERKIREERARQYVGLDTGQPVAPIVEPTRVDPLGQHGESVSV